jgi:hypothetical protein
VQVGDLPAHGRHRRLQAREPGFNLTNILSQRGDITAHRAKVLEDQVFDVASYRCLGQLQMSWCWLITSVVLRRRFYDAAAALALRFLVNGSYTRHYA